MIDKLKNFGYNLVNDNQTKALVASIVINIILIICLLSMLITGNVPGHSNSSGDTEITACTLEHVSSTRFTTTTTTTTATTTTTTRKANNNNSNNTTTKKATTTTTKMAATTTTAANRDNDGEWVEGWY